MEKRMLIVILLYCFGASFMIFFNQVYIGALVVIIGILISITTVVEIQKDIIKIKQSETDSSFIKAGE